MATTTITLQKPDIKQAIAQFALALAGNDPNTAGLNVVVRMSEEVDVLVGASCRAGVTITTPGGS